MVEKKMNKTTYDSIVEAFSRDDKEYLYLIAKIVDMSDQAKHVLRKKGYGWTGLDILQTCKLVPTNTDAQENLMDLLSSG